MSLVMEERLCGLAGAGKAALEAGQSEGALGHPALRLHDEARVK